MMVHSDIEQTIKQLIGAVVEREGFDLVDLNLHQRNKTWGIEVCADRPTQGITLEECTKLNKNIVKAIEEDGTLGDDYTVEVSSPGLDRPLKTEKDFKRVLQQEVHFFLLEPILDRKEISGVVCAVSENHVNIQYKDEQICIPFDVIDKGMQIV